jgi:hypothetical protein
MNIIIEIIYFNFNEKISLLLFLFNKKQRIR